MCIWGRRSDEVTMVRELEEVSMEVDQVCKYSKYGRVVSMEV